MDESLKKQSQGILQGAPTLGFEEKVIEPLDIPEKEHNPELTTTATTKQQGDVVTQSTGTKAEDSALLNETSGTPYMGGSTIPGQEVSASLRAADGSEGNPFYLEPQNRFVTVKPYKITLPSLQQEFTVDTVDPQKIAYVLATMYQGVPKSNFVGYQYVAPELEETMWDSSTWAKISRQVVPTFKKAGAEVVGTIGKDAGTLLGIADSVLKSDEAKQDFAKIGSMNLFDLINMSPNSEVGEDIKVLKNKYENNEEFKNLRKAIEDVATAQLAIKTINGLAQKEDSSWGNSLWNESERMIANATKELQETMKDNALVNPTLGAEVMQAVPTSLAAMAPTLALGPWFGPALRVASYRESILHELMDKGMTYAEAEQEATKGGVISGAIEFATAQAGSLLSKYFLRNYAANTLSRALAAGTMSYATKAPFEVIGETYQEKVENYFAQNVGLETFTQFDRQDIIVALSSLIAEMPDVATSARHEYIKSREKLKTKEEREKYDASVIGRLKELVEHGRAFREVFMKLGFTEEQADIIVMQAIANGKEQYEHYLQDAMAGHLDRLMNGELQETINGAVQTLAPASKDPTIFAREEYAKLNEQLDKALAGIYSSDITESDKNAIKALYRIAATEWAYRTGNKISEFSLPKFLSKRLPDGETARSFVQFKKSTGERVTQEIHLSDKISQTIGVTPSPDYLNFSSLEPIMLTTKSALTHEVVHDILDTFARDNNIDPVAFREFINTINEFGLKKAYDKKTKSGTLDKLNSETAINYADRSPDKVREGIKTGKAGPYNAPTNFTEYAAQATGFLGKDSAKMLGMGTSKSWAFLSKLNRILAAMNDVTPLSSGIQNWLKEFESFVKQNSDTLVRLAEAKGLNNLKTALAAIKDGNMDAINWKDISWDDLKQLTDLINKPLNAQGMAIAKEILDGYSQDDIADVTEKMWESAWAIDKDNNIVENNPVQNVDSANTETDLDEVELDDLLDPFGGITNELRPVGYQASPTAQYDQPALVDEYGRTLIGTGEGSEAHMRGSYFLKDKFRDKAAYYYLLGFRDKSIPLKAKINFGKTDDYGNFEKTIALDHDSVMKIFGDALYDELIRDDAIQHFVNWETSTYMVVVSGKEKYKSTLEHYATNALEANGADFLSDEEYGISDIRSVEIGIADDARGQIMEALLPDQDLMFEENLRLDQQSEFIQNAVKNIAKEVFVDEDGDWNPYSLVNTEIKSADDIVKLYPTQLYNALLYAVTYGPPYAEDAGEAVRELFVKHGIEGNHYFGGRDGEGWAVFDTSKIEPQRVARGVTEITNFMQNNFLQALANKEQEVKQPKSGFEKQLEKKVDGRTLEEDLDQMIDLVKNTKRKRGISAWLSERRGILGPLFSLGGFKALNMFGFTGKQQAFRDMYNGRMGDFRNKVIKEMFDGDSLAYSLFITDFMARNITTKVMDPVTHQEKEIKVSKNIIAQAMLSYAQDKSNGAVRTRATFLDYDNLIKNMDEKDIAFMNMMRANLKEMSTKSFKQQKGESVGRILENYFPMVSWKAVSEDSPASTLSFFSRKDTTSPIGVIGAIEVFGRYHGRLAGSDSEYFHTVKRMGELLDYPKYASKDGMVEATAQRLALKSRELRELVARQIGTSGLKNIEKFLDYVKSGNATRDTSNGVFGKIARTISPALLGGKLKNFFTNVTQMGYWLGAPVKDAPTYWAEVAGVLSSSVKKTYEEFMEIGKSRTGTGFFKLRKENAALTEFVSKSTGPGEESLIKDFAVFLRSKNLTNLADLVSVTAWFAGKMTNIVMAPNIFGDVVGNMFGAVAYRRALIKENLNKGMSNEDAILDADNRVIDFVLARESSTNQAVKPKEILEWNRNSAIFASLGQFTGETTASWGAVGQAYQGYKMGEIDKKSATKEIISILSGHLAYRAIQAGLFGAAFSAAIGELDDEEKEFVWENIGDHMAQEIIEGAAGPYAAIANSVILSRLNDRSYGISIPVISETNELMASLEKLTMGALTEEEIETSDLVRAIGSSASMVGAFPALENILNSIRGAYLAAFGDTAEERKKGRYMASGRTERFSEKAAGIKRTGKKKVDYNSAIK